MVDTQIGTLGYDVLDIADYVIKYENEHDHCINNLKLQKILYFLQAQFIVGYGKALFSDAIVAWDWGPVVEKVYYAYNIYAGASIFINKAHYRNAYIEREHRATIDEMLEQIRPYSSTQLVNICHNQTPWKNARNRWNKIISLSEMREFFMEDSPNEEEKCTTSELRYDNKVYNLDLRAGAEGYLVDGRYYCIKSIPSIMARSDGKIKYGDIELQIDETHYTMRVSEFLENVKTIGNLQVR